MKEKLEYVMAKQKDLNDKWEQHWEKLQRSKQILMLIISLLQPGVVNAARSPSQLAFTTINPVYILPYSQSKAL